MREKVPIGCILADADGTAGGSCSGSFARCKVCRSDLCAAHWRENHDADYCREMTLSFPKDRGAVSLGARGGRKGGIARAASLSPERRSEIASKAARTRWAHTKEPSHE